MSFGATMPTVLVNGNALGLLCFFLWGAVRPGLHSPVTPGRLLVLGWFVLIAGPVELQMRFPWWYVFAGVAALIVAKLLRIEVRMAEELEGTI
jgi:hypothetical protein